MILTSTFLYLEPKGNEQKLAYKTGLYVVVHNQSTVPFTLRSGIYIPAGYETYVGVNRVITNKMGKPYSECLEGLTSDNTYAKKLFGYFNDLNVTYYDQQFCFTLCYQDKLINECGCCDINTPIIKNSKYCASDTEMKCMKNFDANFSKSDMNVICESACAEQCDSVEYKLDVSQATFPTLTYLKVLQTDYNNGDIFPQNVPDSELKEFGRENFLKIIVNYDNLYYTLIEESPSMTSEGLFANVGGNLGLFIGLSILSLIEIFELFVTFVVVTIHHIRSDEVDEYDIAKKNYPFYNRVILFNPPSRNVM